MSGATTSVERAATTATGIRAMSTPTIDAWNVNSRLRYRKAGRLFWRAGARPPSRFVTTKTTAPAARTAPMVSADTANPGAAAATCPNRLRTNTAAPSAKLVEATSNTIHATLRRRAAAAGQSLQEYLLGRLIADAQSPTLDEVLDAAGGRAGGRAGFKAATKAVRADRESR